MTDRQKENGLNAVMYEVVYTLSRQKWKILPFVLLGLVATSVVYLTTPALFQSEAKLLVRYIEDDGPMDPYASQGRLVRPDDRSKNVMNAELEILTSPDLARRVAEELGPERVLREITQPLNTTGLVNRSLSRIGLGPQKAQPTGSASVDTQIAGLAIGSRLLVQVLKQSSVLQVSLTAPNPSIAREALSALIDAYLKRHAEIHRNQGYYEFLSKQTDQLRGRLSQTEEELAKLRYGLGIASLEQARDSLFKRSDALTQSLQETEATLAASKARLDILKATANSAATTSATGSGPNVNARLPSVKQARLALFRQRENALLAAFAPDSVPVRNLHDQIAALEQEIAADATALARDTSNQVVSAYSSQDLSALNRDILESQAQVVSLEARSTSLRAQAQKVQADLQKLQSLEEQISNLQRKRDIEETNYKYFLQSLEKARIDDAVSAGKVNSISIIQPATLPIGALKPNLQRNMAIALAVALALGLGLAFVSEKLFDHSLRQTSEVEAVLRTPVMIALPASAGGRGAARNRPLLARHHAERTFRVLPAHATADSAPASAQVVPPQTEQELWTVPNGLAAYYESLRDHLLLAIKRTPGHPYLVGITGCQPSRSGNSVAGGLAVALARNGDGRVLMLNASALARPIMADTWDQHAATGLLEVFADGQGRTTIIQPNLYVMAAQEVDSNQPRFTSARNLEEFVQQARASAYDFILFELPPMTGTSPGLRLAPLMDGVLLVVESEQTNRAAARETRVVLERIQANVIGAIVTDQKNYVPTWLHHAV